jgi:hypothetical protein
VGHRGATSPPMIKKGYTSAETVKDAAKPHLRKSLTGSARCGTGEVIT